MSETTTRLEPLDPRPLADRTCLVTGASRGIGRSIALEFARCGADVVVNYRSSDAAAREGESIIEEMENALERGVDVDVLMTREMVASLGEEVGRRYRDRLTDDPNFQVRTSEDVTGTFNLIDDIEVVIQVPNPLGGTEAFAMIDLKDPEFAADVHDKFRPTWSDAEPLSF